MVRLLVPILLAATIASARPVELPKPNEKWLTLRADEFTLVSNISASETSAIARDLLRMRHAIGQVTNLKVRSPKQTRIFVFGSERGFAPYREAITGQKNETIRGVFTSSDGGNFIVMIRDDDDEDIDRTVYHELTHYFVRNTTSGLPLWLSEGIAEYYSTFRTSGDAVHIGRPIAEHVHWMRQQTLIPLGELFATTVDSPLYNESQRAGVFYAQSWALFHYLMVDDTRRAQLSAYLRNLTAGEPVENAFAKAFGKSYADLEVELRGYVRKQAFSYTKYLLSAASLPELAKPEPMPREELLFELGHLLVHSAPDATAEARRFLDAVLEENPAHAGAHADVGRLHHMAGQRQEATVAFARAVHYGSSDPLVYLLAGMSALDDIKGTRTIGPPDEALLKARKVFERSVELDPASALGWTGLGATYVFTNEESAPGIAALEKALELAPSDANAAFYLVQLYARGGRPADARRLVDDVLSRSGTKDMLDFARNAVRTASRNASVRLINDAIRKANEGHVEEAVAILDGLMPGLDDEEIVTKVKELRADLASDLGRKKP